MKMAPVFVWSRREDKNIVDVGGAEGEIAEDSRLSIMCWKVALAKAEVIECIRSKGRGDGGLWDIEGIHRHLIVTLQEV